jgi:hypothetical protein
MCLLFVQTHEMRITDHVRQQDSLQFACQMCAFHIDHPMLAVGSAPHTWPYPSRTPYKGQARGLTGKAREYGFYVNTAIAHRKGDKCEVVHTDRRTRAEAKPRQQLPPKNRLLTPGKTVQPNPAWAVRVVLSSLYVWRAVAWFTGSRSPEFKTTRAMLRRSPGRV